MTIQRMNVCPYRLKYHNQDKITSQARFPLLLRNRAMLIQNKASNATMPGTTTFIGFSICTYT